MAEEAFRVPNSSLNELERIIVGYSELESDVSLDDISNLVGMNRTTVSPNNGFLESIGIIEGGKKKNATELGKNLGFAIRLNQASEVELYWRRVVEDNDFLSRVVSTVAIRKGMSHQDLASHILYTLKVRPSQRSKTGANSIVDILGKSGLVAIDNGQVTVVEKDEIPSDLSAPAIADDEFLSEESQLDDKTKTTDTSQNLVSQRVQHAKNQPSLHIDINIHISADSSPEQIEQIFASMAKHLYGSGVNGDD